MHICNPSIWDPGAGGAGVLGKPGTHIQIISQIRKKRKKRRNRRKKKRGTAFKFGFEFLGSKELLMLLECFLGVCVLF